MRNKKVDNIELGTNAPRPSDEVVWIDTDNLNVNIYNENTSEWVSVGGSGGGGGAADLVVPTAIKDDNDDDLITFEKTNTGTARIGTPQDDLSLRSARDITLYAGSDGPGNVYIGWGDAEYTPDSPNRVATIGDIQSGTTGDITFDGVKVVGAGTASGDGQSNSTMELVPDGDLYANDQYLIIDPTDPNHIHIRGGGTIDESNSKLILGGEKNNVYVSDSQRLVNINTRPPVVIETYLNDNQVSSTTFLTTNASDISVGYTVNVDGTDYIVDSVTNDSPIEGITSVTASTAFFTSGNNYTFSHEQYYTNLWTFDTDGTFYGPAMGSVRVTGIMGVEDYPLYIQSSSAVLITSSGSGQFLNSIEPNNQIATIGDISSASSNYAPTNNPEFTVDSESQLVMDTFIRPNDFGGDILLYGYSAGELSAGSQIRIAQTESNPTNIDGVYTITEVVNAFGPGTSVNVEGWSFGEYTNSAHMCNVYLVEPATVSSTELSYLDGVTSSIQTQLDSALVKGMTVIETGTLSGTTIRIQSIPQTYKSIILKITSPLVSTAGNTILLYTNNSPQDYVYYSGGFSVVNPAAGIENLSHSGNKGIKLCEIEIGEGVKSSAEVEFPLYSEYNIATMMRGNFATASDAYTFSGHKVSVDPVTEINLTTTDDTTELAVAAFTGGVYTLYGVN